MSEKGSEPDVQLCRFNVGEVAIAPHVRRTSAAAPHSYAAMPRMPCMRLAE
jgi:hypothetical protein